MHEHYGWIMAIGRWCLMFASITKILSSLDCQSTNGLIYEEFSFWNNTTRGLRMWNLCHKHAKFEVEGKQLDGTKRPTRPQTLVCWSKSLCESCQKTKCIFYLCFSFTRCWITFTWNSFPIPRIQRCVWEEKCEHLAQTSTIWLHHSSCGRNTTFIQTHL